MKYFLGAVFILFMLVRTSGVLARSRAKVTSPGGVVQQLKTTGKHIETIPSGRFAWNPAFPTSQQNRVPGPGRATYSLDSQGVVTLDFAPTSGAAQRFTGSVPEGLSVPDPLPSLANRAIAPAVAIIAGVGAVLLAGTPVSHHISRFALVGIIAWFLVSVLLMATGQVRRQHAYVAARQ